MTELNKMPYNSVMLIRCFSSFCRKYMSTKSHKTEMVENHIASEIYQVKYFNPRTDLPVDFVRHDEKKSTSIISSNFRRRRMNKLIVSRNVTLYSNFNGKDKAWIPKSSKLAVYHVKAHLKTNDKNKSDIKVGESGKFTSVLLRRAQYSSTKYLASIKY